MPPSADRGRRITPAVRFASGPGPVVALILAYSAWILVSNVLLQAVLGPDPSRVGEVLWNVPSGIAQLAILWLVLRREGVSFAAMGAWRGHMVPGIVAAVGFLVFVNVAVIAVGFLRAEPVSFGVFAIYRTPPLELSWAVVLLSALVQYLIVGPIEELVFRGYLQNKLASLVRSGRAWLRQGIAILSVATAFAALHVPTLLWVEQATGAGLVGSLVLLASTGILFGAIYALTGNLVLVALLHGFGNFWPLVVDPGVAAWPNWGIVLTGYVLVVLAYRAWWRRRDRGVSSTP